MEWIMILLIFLGIIASPLVFVLFLLTGELVVSFYESVILTPKEFIKKKGKIVSVNGIKDNDTGLLSSGSVSQNRLLFEDGEIITIDNKIDRINLNKECIVYFTKTKYLEEESLSRIEYPKEKPHKIKSKKVVRR